MWKNPREYQKWLFFQPWHDPKTLPPAREGHTCYNYKPKDSQTMHAQCCLSRGCFPGCREGEALPCSQPWMDQLVCPLRYPSWKGTLLWDAYIPRGCWCHCGTCLLHSQLLSAPHIYLHSRLFSTELHCIQQRIVLCLWLSLGVVVVSVLSSFLGFMNATSLADNS